MKNLDVKLKRTIEDPLAIFQSEVVRSGNGAVIKAYKRYEGKKATVIIEKDLTDHENDKDFKDKYELD